MTTKTIVDNAGWIFDRIRDAGLDPNQPLAAIDTLVKAYVNNRDGFGWVEIGE